MKHRRQLLHCNRHRLLIGSLLLGTTAGCLSLGGGTTYVQEKPETGERLQALEFRVEALEEVITTQPTIAPNQASHGIATDAYEPTASPSDGSY